MTVCFGPGRKALALGIFLNLFVVFVWAFTRVFGLPAWTVFVPLAVGALDLTATAAELVLVILLVRVRRDLPRKERRSKRRVGTLLRGLLGR